MLDEAEQVFGAEKRVSCIFSIGSGVASLSPMSSNIALARWEVHALLQAMEMQQRSVTEEARRRFGNLEAYFRLSVEGIGSECLRDWTHWDADLVETRAQTYFENPTHSNELDAAVGQLIGRVGTITLNRLSKSDLLSSFRKFYLLF